VKIDAATADEVEAAVALCASGALRTRRAGVRVEKRAKPLEVCASANGPLLVSGGVRILDAEGDLLFEREKVALAAAAVRATNRSDTTARTRRTAFVARGGLRRIIVAASLITATRASRTRAGS
jgi:uncharacterized protein (UPF0261 family)